MIGPDSSAGTPSQRRPRVHPPGTVTIRCRRDGPLVVELAAGLAAEGVRIRVTDHEDREFPAAAAGKPALALCRCGQSRRRPFCDGTHGAAGFRAAEAAPDQSPEPSKDPPSDPARP
ncbi:MAG: CDGSH iron-sulfur domain-containing protein [Planctomycetia bacterium]|nr:CDGSH iron-sulfur domain-containing protein [Planctomycetia bacterium]